MAAVAETKNMDKSGESGPGAAPGLPSWLSGPLGWGPRKLGELRSFLTEVRAELKKVTWPGREEVRATTVVVIGATFFFGFYLWALDLGFSWLLSNILRK